MRRVLPSDIVRALDEQIPFEGQPPKRRRSWKRFLVSDYSPLSGLLGALNDIPEELLILDSRERLRLAVAVGALNRAVDRSLGPPYGFSWPQLPGEDGDCLTIVRNTLAKCPDEAPSQSTKGLPFITDKDTREAIFA